MSQLTSKAFWSDAFERAVKTAAQTLVVTLGAGAVDLLSVPWEATLSMSAGAALLSVLSSVASVQIGNSGTASLTTAVEVSSPTPGTDVK